jgi:hypothetical protein
MRIYHFKTNETYRGYMQRCAACIDNLQYQWICCFAVCLLLTRISRQTYGLVVSDYCDWSGAWVVVIYVALYGLCGSYIGHVAACLGHVHVHLWSARVINLPGALAVPNGS